MSHLLTDKEIVVGVSGGIAAYKAVEFSRSLVKAGSSVRVIMTRSAAKFVGPLTFEALSGHPVWMEMFDRRLDSVFPHITWAERADAVVVIPATANIIGKIAHGIADDPLTTFLTAVTAPVIICPSMNVRMYENARVQKNIESVRASGIDIVEASSGQLACGGEGIGRLADLDTILERLQAVLSVQDLKGAHVVVTAGPTREALDPVRFISNPASGKMGYAVARAAQRRGADVVLVSGPTSIPPPQGVGVIRVESAEEMYHAVMEHTTDRSIVIKAAAVSDWRPKEVFDRKVKKEALSETVAFERTRDILQALGDKKTTEQVLVGFAAETENLSENAADKLAAKNLDMIVANPVGKAESGFGADMNQATLLFRDGSSERLPLCSKESMADTILDKVVAMRTRGR